MSLWLPESAGNDPTRIPIEFDPQQQFMRGTAVHGNTPFSVPFVSQITDDLWTGGCQDGLFLPREIVHLVSLYPWERYREHGDLRSSLHLRMYDSEDQAFDQVNAIAAWVNVCRLDGPTLVHCQAGLNRSGLVAARALTLGGMDAADAIALLREKRSPAVLCNKHFEAWLTTPADLEEAA